MGTGRTSRVINADFPVPAGLRSGHLQSIRNRLRPARHGLDAIALGRTSFVSMDDGTGDRLAVTIHALPTPSRGLVLLVHGLGGSAESVYIRATAAALLGAGFNVARVDLRCAGVSKLTSTFTYHAGKTDDLRVVLRYLATRREAVAANSLPTLAIVGFSLGGAMTIKLLGEPHEGLPIVAGVAVSAPLDLVVGAEYLSGAGFGVYERAVLRSLRNDVLTPAPDGSPRLTDAERSAVHEARSLPDFDNAITAPRHGFRDSHEYYAVNSAAPFLPLIEVPTLVIHALDDPMIPPGPYEDVDWASLQRSGHVTRAITPRGGHVGFHQSGNPMPWYTGRIVEFLNRNFVTL